jgi:replication factor C subunit 3/5
MEDLNINYLPWIEKYRPKKMNEIISHDQNIETIKKLLLNYSLPHLLFYGCPGTGKTSTILALAKEIYGDNIRLMVLKLDASDDRGINSVREDIKGFAEKTNMFQKGVKLIILDEADSMTFDAQSALRRIIEKYSETVRFCLICNYDNKIIPAIRSRCANFRFNNIEIKHITSKLKEICINEKLNYNDDIINSISLLVKGDLRKAINFLQTISMQYKELTNDLCYELAGIPSNIDIKEMLVILLDKNITFNKCLDIIRNTIMMKDYSLSIILKELIIEIINNENYLNKMPQIISDLSDLENLVTKSTFEDIYISALISIFKK